MNNIKGLFKKLYLSIINVIVSNRLFITYVLFAFVGTIFLRYNTIGDSVDFLTYFIDMAFILIVGSFAFLFKPKNQFKYLVIVLFILYFAYAANSIYYTFYSGFASINLFTSLSQTGEVADSVFDRLKFMDFVYVPFLILFIVLHNKLKKSTYYNYISRVENGKRNFGVVLIIALLLLIVSSTKMTKTDYSRLAKQWDREYIVKRFGIVMYTGNDIVQSLIPKFTSFFGYENALNKFNTFYEENPINHQKNKYTNILEGKNVIFIHMESIQSNMLGYSFNGEQVLPSIHQLIDEGMYFSNFYPQISTGTSSDTEFTVNTSLMPSLSSTVAVSYYNREYITTEKLLKEKGYYTFSMHGNKASMWNREKLHDSFGYDRFYSKKDFTVNSDNTVGLGISDHDFFLQIAPYLEEIESNNKNYMGTIITLSNHSPFNDLEKYGEYSLSVHTKRLNESTNSYTYVDDNYLEGTPLGNYIHSVHYSDMALGEFFDYVRNSEYFNDTVFVLYGDHDAKISRSQYNKYYNYDYTKGEILDKDDPNYDEYDTFEHNLNKNTPLIIWTKNPELRNKLHGVVEYPMGMYDVLPTIGNMMNFYSPYQLGHDIFNVKEKNVVIFPNGNFLTDKIYYDNSAGESYIIPKYDKDGKLIEDSLKIQDDYLSSLKKYTEDRLVVSNSIIVHDLIRKTKELDKDEETNE